MGNDELRERVPKRRLHLTLDLGADDLTELTSALHLLANDLEYEGVEERTTTSGGSGSGYHLTLTCDRLMTATKYRHDLAVWAEHRRLASSEGVDGGR